MTERAPYLASRLQGLGTTIFAEMSALATATGAVNLGQGFPDTDGPAEVAEAAIAAIRAGHNQYPPGPGIPALRAAIAEHQHRFWGLDYDPDTEVLVTAGATEAIAAALLAVFEGTHHSLASQPGMRERTIVISSAGKTFSFTGWKVGWVCAPPDLVAAVRTTKQFLTYVNAAPFQHAVAVGLRLGDDYFTGLR